MASGFTPLRSPCCDAVLYVTTRMEGSGHLTTDVPDEFECSAEGCYNSWDAKTGEPASFNRR